MFKLYNIESYNENNYFSRKLVSIILKYSYSHWQRGESHVLEVHNKDPVFDLARQQHVVHNTLEEVGHALEQHLLGHNLYVYFLRVHDYNGTEAVVTTLYLNDA